MGDKFKMHALYIYIIKSALHTEISGHYIRNLVGNCMKIKYFSILMRLFAVLKYFLLSKFCVVSANFGM